jgi:hypothetical protein
LNNLLQIPSTSSRAESSLNSAAVDESELVRRLRNQISQLDKDMVGLHAMAALVKKKSELATAVEQHALDRLRVATESLSCKQSTPFCFLYFSLERIFP